MRYTWQRWKAAGDRRGYGSLAELWGVGASTARDIVQYRTRPCIAAHPREHRGAA